MLFVFLIVVLLFVLVCFVFVVVVLVVVLLFVLVCCFFLINNANFPLMNCIYCRSCTTKSKLELSSNNNDTHLNLHQKSHNISKQTEFRNP